MAATEVTNFPSFDSSAVACSDAASADSGSSDNLAEEFRSVELKVGSDGAGDVAKGNLVLKRNS